MLPNLTHLVVPIAVFEPIPPDVDDLLCHTARAGTRVAIVRSGWWMDDPANSGGVFRAEVVLTGGTTPDDAMQLAAYLLEQTSIRGNVDRISTIHLGYGLSTHPPGVEVEVAFDAVTSDDGTRFERNEHTSRLAGSIRRGTLRPVKWHRMHNEDVGLRFRFDLDPTEAHLNVLGVLVGVVAEWTRVEYGPRILHRGEVVAEPQPDGSTSIKIATDMPACTWRAAVANRRRPEDDTVAILEWEEFLTAEARAVADFAWGVRELALQADTENVQSEGGVVRVLVRTGRKAMQLAASLADGLVRADADGGGHAAWRGSCWLVMTGGRARGLYGQPPHMDASHVKRLPEFWEQQLFAKGFVPAVVESHGVWHELRIEEVKGKFEHFDHNAEVVVEAVGTWMALAAQEPVTIDRTSVSSGPGRIRHTVLLKRAPLPHPSV